MKLRLTRTFAEGFELTTSTAGDSEDDQSFSFAIAAPEKPGKQFQIKIDTLVSVESIKRLHVLYVGIFETDEDVDINFLRDNSFANVNAPAIVYPYLRAFVTTVLINAGLNPVILPAVNFQAIFKERAAAGKSRV